jgi:uncharacterized membrane protein
MEKKKLTAKDNKDIRRYSLLGIVLIAFAIINLIRRKNIPFNTLQSVFIFICGICCFIVVFATVYDLGIVKKFTKKK